MMSPGSRLIAYADRNHTISVCDAETFAPLVRPKSAWDQFRMEGSYYSSIVMRPSMDSRSLLITSGRVVTFWDPQTPGLLWSARGEELVRAADFHPQGNWIAVIRSGARGEAESTGTLELLNPADGRVVRSLPLPERRAGDVRVLQDGRLLIGSGTRLRLLTERGEVEWTCQINALDAPILRIVISPDGLQVVASTTHNRAYAVHPLNRDRFCGGDRTRRMATVNKDVIPPGILGRVQRFIGS